MRVRPALHRPPPNPAPREATATSATTKTAEATENTEATTAPPDESVENPKGGMFAALAVPNFRVYVTGSFISNIGTWMQRVAQDWLVLELSGGSGVAIGITTALQFLPMLLMSAYGGLVADRFDKRTVLKITQAWLAISAAALGILAVTGVATVPMVFVIAFCFGIGTAFDNPARQSFVSEVVGRDRLPNAIGLNSATFHAARIVGPALAGLVIAWAGSGWAILSNAVTYLAFIAALVIIDPGRLEPSPAASRGKRQIRAGLAYVAGRSDILLVLLVVFFVGTFGMNFQLTSALMAQQEFGKGPEAYGILGTFMAIGSLAGALLAARRTAAPRGRFIVLMAMTFGAIEIVAGLMPSYASYAAVLPIMGLAALLTMTASNASVQMGVDPRLRGRVMALYAMVLMGGTPIGAPLIGWVGEAFGPRWTLIGGGALTILGVLLAVAFIAHREQLKITDSLRTLPHPHLTRSA
jgi:MFS family permease